eukprot:scaffold13469_cov45-Prasinocladus_malaysianus.AAC.2
MHKFAARINWGVSRELREGHCVRCAPGGVDGRHPRVPGGPLPHGGPGYRRRNARVDPPGGDGKLDDHRVRRERRAVEAAQGGGTPLSLYELDAIRLKTAGPVLTSSVK